MKVIFLTGHRKAGTTLLHKLFDGHPGLCVYPVDISLFYAYFPSFTDDPELDCVALRERAAKVVRQSFSQTDQTGVELDMDRLIGNFLERLSDAELRNRAAVLTALLRSWQQLGGYDTELPILVKETSQAIFFENYANAFPGLKMLNLLRDPRDNYAALKAGVERYYSKLGENNLETLASLLNRARMDFIAARHNEDRYPEHFRNVGFEDLAADPRGTMRKLAIFLDIDYLDTLAEPTLLGKAFQGNSHEGLRFDGVSPQNVRRWRDRISPEEAMVIEYWMAQEMKWAGYEPGYEPEQSQAAFARFYDWYNARYFFRDAFS